MEPTCRPRCCVEGCKQPLSCEDPNHKALKAAMMVAPTNRLMEVPESMRNLLGMESPDMGGPTSSDMSQDLWNGH